MAANFNNRTKQSSQQGFTLVEIIIATAIFTIVVGSVLALFNSVLHINRRVQATRQITQATRNFTEVLSREIRNGRIDYPTDDSCPYLDYTDINNHSLAITSYTGERICFYMNPSVYYDNFILKRISASGTVTEEKINPSNIWMDRNMVHFIVRPTYNPSAGSSIQPMVTILASFKINEGTDYEKVIDYQTTISTDVYDIPHQ